METLGQFLKREREFRGISREKLYQSTRISQSMLKVLEEDLPIPSNQSIYARSFLKNYAQQVGLDANEILARFKTERGDPSSSAVPIAGLQPKQGASRAALIALAVLILLGLAAYWAKR